METDVQFCHGIDAALFHFFPGTPFLIGADHLTELGAPVSQMVDPNGPVTQEIENTFQAVADHGGGQMTDMETLGYIDGRIVQADGFSRTDI